MSTPSEMTPVEIDTILSKIWQKTWEANGYLANALQRLDRINSPAAGQRRSYERLEDVEDEIEKYKARIAVLRAESAPYEAEYERREWNRYFLVTNASGHVHRGTNCSTCFPTTQYAWLIDLADCDENLMVEEYGEKACTVCFPNAPTNPAFRGPGRRGAAAVEARAARAAETARRVAEKEAKKITAPDGSPLFVVGWQWQIQTKAEAKAMLGRVTRDHVRYTGRPWPYANKPDDFAMQVRQLAEALAAAGVDPNPIIDKATKNVQRDMRMGR